MSMSTKIESQYFITNTGKNSLSNIIKGIIPAKTSSLDFLVGYFYFSGIEELYQNIEDQQIRILVGMEMDRELQDQTARASKVSKTQRSSRQDIRYENYKDIVSLFNNTDFFESKKKLEAFKIYFDKIKNGTLEIRKTKEPSHAKMYIFSYKEELSENGETPGTVITGSSNLTYSGLTGRSEINVRFQNKTEYNDASRIFNSLWDDAIILADQNHIEEFEEQVIQRTWYEKIYPPYLLYLRVLYEYFNIDTKKRIHTPHEITKGVFFNLKYQEDAVRMGLDTIKKHNGVIIADVVGLGKSIIASTIANNLNLRTIVISPPHLVNQWEDYRVDFQFNATVFSRGVMEKVLDHLNSRKRPDEEWLIIIDEAHNYRNEFTRDYDILKTICAGHKVMLLTATPFNNEPADIYSMIKLFQIPSKSTLQTVDNLGVKFRDLISRYKVLKKQQREKKITEVELKKSIDYIASQIRNIISPLVIRRSRLDLDAIPEYKEDLRKQQIDFAEIVGPTLLDYDLGNLKELYKETLHHISNNNIDEIDRRDYEDSEDGDIKDSQLGNDEFKATRYKPIMYVKEEHKSKVKKTIEDAGHEFNLFVGTQRNLARFMRSLLVRRFESSQHAFKISLNNMLATSLNIKNWADKRNAVPVFKKGNLPDIEDLYATTDDIIPEMVDMVLEDSIQKLQTRGMFEIRTEYLSDEFFKDLDNDIKLLKDLRDKWNKVDHDPKVSTFVKMLQELTTKDPNRKIIVFSQFADTIEYLEQKLIAEQLPVFAYTARKANDTNKEVIKSNFDAGYAEHKQLDNYQILVATDAISEGYNLHRAGTIFNFDIPYNPTVVIQRIGRINRINKKVFDELFIYNYFPTDIGEAEVRTKQISTLKMDMIHAIMGEDTKVLTTDEELQSFFTSEYKKIFADSEQKSWDTDYRAKLNQLIGTIDMKKALELPLRTKTQRLTTNEENDGLILFAKKGNEYLFKFAEDEDNVHDISPSDALQLLECEPDEKGYAVSETFHSKYDAAKAAMSPTVNKNNIDKAKRKAYDKLRVIKASGKCDPEYIKDLQTVIEYDALSGYALRLINRIKPKEFETLPELISADFIYNILRTYDSIDEAVETLILAEEITLI